MANIKIKNKSNIKIKKFKKAEVYRKKIKNNIVNIKNRTSNSRDEENITEYGTSKIENNTRILAHKGVKNLNKYGKISEIKTKDNIEYVIAKVKQKAQIRNIKNKLQDNKNINNNIRNIKSIRDKNSIFSIKNLKTANLK